MAKSFAQQMEDFVNGVGESSNKVVRSAGLNVFRGVTLRTPVKEGRARANMNLDLNTFDTSVRDFDDDTGLDVEAPRKSNGSNEAIIRAASRLKQFQAGDTITITNGLPYIKKLEFGSSKQAPNGMFAITVQEFQQRVREAAARERNR